VVGIALGKYKNRIFNWLPFLGNSDGGGTESLRPPGQRGEKRAFQETAKISSLTLETQLPLSPSLNYMQVQSSSLQKVNASCLGCRVLKSSSSRSTSTTCYVVRCVPVSQSQQNSSGSKEILTSPHVFTVHTNPRFNITFTALTTRCPAEDKIVYTISSDKGRVN